MADFKSFDPGAPEEPKREAGGITVPPGVPQDIINVMQRWLDKYEESVTLGGSFESFYVIGIDENYSAAVSMLGNDVLTEILKGALSKYSSIRHLRDLMYGRDTPCRCENCRKERGES